MATFQDDPSLTFLFFWSTT